MVPEDRPPTPTKLSEEEQKRRQALLAELSAEWDRKLECLNQPGAHARVDAMFEASGRTKKRSKAGEF